MNRKCKKCGFIDEASNMRYSKLFKGWVCRDSEQCYLTLIGEGEG